MTIQTPLQTTLFDSIPAHSYHNTVPVHGAELIAAEEQAQKQEAEILRLFQRYQRLTPWQVEARLNSMGRKWPITSIRRAITNLTQRDKRLTKLSEKIIGPLGHKESVWQIV